MRIERKGIVRTGEIHDAIHNHRRRFQDPGSLGVKDPLRLQVRGILWSDLGKAAEASAGVVAVVGRPVVFDGAGRSAARKDWQPKPHAQTTNKHTRRSFMRSVPLIAHGNQYLSQCSAIGAIAIDEVNRNSGYFLICINRLVE